MNGFEAIPIPRGGVLQRLARRPVKERAFAEIRNHLADNPLTSLTAGDVAAILARNGLSRQEATEGFVEIYRIALTHFVTDSDLSAEEREGLANLQTALELADSDVAPARLAAVQDAYRRTVAEALADGERSPEDIERLNKTAGKLGMSEDAATEVYKQEATKLLQWTFEQAMADRRYSAEEERAFEAVAKNLGVEVQLGEQSLAVIERAKLLHRVEQGELPVRKAAVALRSGEVCHAVYPAYWKELRTVTTRVNYSGPTGSIRIMKGVRWRVGSVAVQRVSQDILTTVDTGILYLTSKRLLFSGEKKGSSILFPRVVSFTVYRDGMQVKKDTGKDHYFVGYESQLLPDALHPGDTEVLGAILEGAMRNAR
jgi:hypothetical protein